jgi:hypothetical protein
MADILSTKQFHAQTLSNDPDTGGGASRRSTDRRVPAHGTTMVGGATDRNGNQIPERQVPVGKFTPAVVQEHLDHIRSVTGHDHSVYQGSWRETDERGNEHVSMDASNGYANRAQGRLRALQRGERAVYVVGVGERRTKPKRPVKR